MSVFDTSKKVVIGDIAHDAADSGSPIKLGGKAATSIPAAVSNADRVNAYFDEYGRLHTYAETGITDDAAAAGVLHSVAALYQATVDEVDTGDLGRLRMTKRRTLYNVADCQQLVVTGATPVPSGSDLFVSGGGAIASTDLAIRDTAAHTIIIPMSAAGWRHVVITAYTSSAFDQPITATLLAGASSYTFWSQLLTFTIPASGVLFSIGEGAVGLGGIAGAATAAISAYYGCSAIGAGWPYLELKLQAGTGPSTGTIDLYISRSS